MALERQTRFPFLRAWGKEGALRYSFCGYASLVGCSRSAQRPLPRSGAFGIVGVLRRRGWTRLKTGAIRFRDRQLVSSPARSARPADLRAGGMQVRITRLTRGREAPRRFRLAGFFVSATAARRSRGFGLFLRLADHGILGALRVSELDCGKHRLCRFLHRGQGRAEHGGGVPQCLHLRAGCGIDDGTDVDFILRRDDR